ncbi:MAG: DUF2314 domain-containing protein [Armatimonadetes bacterium]|nr:DUF2314 domain-containing protein [Armatimonadota bacterium]
MNRIRLPEAQQVSFVVYFQPSEAEPTDPESLKRAIAGWLEAHAPEPMRMALRRCADSDQLRLLVGERDIVADPPLEVLGWFRPGELEERLFREATHAAVAVAADIVAPMRPGFWTAAAAARALAQALRGVILDPAIPRLLPLDAAERSIPDDGRIVVPDHILLPASPNRRGLIWMTSKGMARFGLPELEIRDVPPHLQDALANVMNGMAHHLLTESAALASQAGGPPAELVVGSEIRLTLDELLHARGAVGHALPPEGARGWTMLGVRYRAARRGDALLRLVPPPPFQGQHSVWLTSVLSDLLGPLHEQVATVPTRSEGMEAAHRRALSELPAVKQRFQVGLREGEVLLVKHGFAGDPAADVEFMWLSVAAWEGDRIRGHLINQPRWRTHLRAGQEVDVRVADIYDWIIAHEEGEFEGGYTNRVALEEGETSDPPV